MDHYCFGSSFPNVTTKVDLSSFREIFPCSGKYTKYWTITEHSTMHVSKICMQTCKWVTIKVQSDPT